MLLTNADLCLPAGYTSRPARNDNLHVTDGAQRRVYRYAAGLINGDPTIRMVLDWGCGSGQKLVEYFGHLDTLGADVDYRLPALQSRFPDRRWAVCPVAVDADVVLCIDVIEHVDDPIDLLRQFAHGTWRHLIIATPERELVARHKYRRQRHRLRQRAGPPLNRWHAREWTAAEFAKLITREIGTPAIKILGRWNLVAHIQR